ncbi:carbohydrate ABC transporter permease [Lapidilactobacillus luobeiensis]|uniref:carbohydrate ABC transporter permease n=1 Tax=Lapidilactobacillus luobeiensis TaxID=2950371 RepID=UPI0021C28FE8|nr:carbohydrate ABC transporter permease [Lapidilactobacillus luobeiensis]
MKRKIFRPTIIYLVLIVGLVVFALPYVYMIIAATQNNATILGEKINFTPGPYFMKNLKEIQEKYNYVKVLWNSAFITIVGTILSTFITTLAGYVMAKYRFKGSNLIFNLVMISRMVPGFAVLIPTFYILSKVGLTNTYAGVIIPGLASTTSVFMMRQYAQKFPTELMEAARIDGAGEWTIFLKIAMPVLTPSIITTALLTFMGYWNSYLMPLVILSDSSKFTIPLVIQNMTQNSYDPLNYGALMAILATSVVPVVLIYMWLQTKFKSNGIDSAIK